MDKVINFPDRHSQLENNMLHGELIIDAWLVLHSQLSPEEFIDLELQRVKEEMLKQFYQRFPGQEPEIDDAN